MSNDEINTAGVVAVLKQHTEQDGENFGHLRDDIADVKADVVALRSEIQEMRDEIATYRGGVRVALWIAGTFGSAVGAIAAVVLQHFWK